MNKTDIAKLISNKKPFILLETHDAGFEQRTRHEIITLQRLEGFKAAGVFGQAAISHLERFGSDDVTERDYRWAVGQTGMVLKRDCKHGQIYDFCNCLAKYHEFSKVALREKIEE